MKKSIHFIPSSLVCSVAIDLTVEDGVIREVCFEGGCSGNLQGISMLVRGMKVEEVIEDWKVYNVEVNVLPVRINW